MLLLLLLHFSSFVLWGCATDINGFDDTVLYDIKWPGNDLDSKLTQLEGDHIIITTAYKEKYKCVLPNFGEKESDFADNYDGPSPLELLAPLFTQSACSYRLESYWTYEVCHSRHIRQYHEDREGKKVKVQEYVLGSWDKNQYSILLEELKSETNKNTPVPYKKIDGNSLPYFEVVMGNGTMCVLNDNKPRVTKVLYVCYAHGKHEVFSVKEESTCVYEVVILSPLLCAHPKYKAPEMGENRISCLPLEDSLERPRNLMKMDIEQKSLKRKSDVDHIRVEFHQLDLHEKEVPVKPPQTSFDTFPVRSFLTGENCLNGGTGWWKYRFCYGKSVDQYHLENDGIQTSINLGRFNKEKHLQWLLENPHKRPKPLARRTHISHLYTDGTACERTAEGEPQVLRQTEVKLKCMQNPSSPTAVSLYLLEPKYCEYILGVESPIICDILSRADDDGLVQMFGQSESKEEDDASVSNVIGD